jgi:hypothetical protein
MVVRIKFLNITFDLIEFNEHHQISTLNNMYPFNIPTSFNPQGVIIRDFLLLIIPKHVYYN